MSAGQDTHPALYLDTSALLLLYLERDPLSSYVLERFEAAGALVVSALSLTEGRSALAQRKARKAMTGAHYSRARARFVQQWPTLSRVPVTERILERAATLCEKHPTLRAADAVHLASVLELSAVGAVQFLTFDARQREVARLELQAGQVLEPTDREETNG